MAKASRHFPTPPLPIVLAVLLILGCLFYRETSVTEDLPIFLPVKHENVYIGCDAHSPKYWPESFVRYINSYGQDKVIFGTDFPVLDFQRTINEINALNFKPEVMQKLLRDNTRRIYKLD